MNLNKIRSEVHKQVIAENLARQSNGDASTLHNGLVVVPEGLAWRSIQRLHNEVLPKIKLHRGEQDVEYLFYIGVRNALIWSTYIQQCYENLLMRYSKQAQYLEFFQGKAGELERELLKHYTAAEILSADAMQVYRAGIVAQALTLLETKNQ